MSKNSPLKDAFADGIRAYPVFAILASAWTLVAVFTSVTDIFTEHPDFPSTVKCVRAADSLIKKPGEFTIHLDEAGTGETDIQIPADVAPGQTLKLSCVAR